MDNVSLVQLQHLEQDVPRDRRNNRQNRTRQAPSERQIWLIRLLVVLAAGILFSLLADEVWEKEGFSWDAPIMLAIHQIQTPWLDTFMLWISDFGLPRGILVVGIGVWLWFRKHRETALALVLSYSGSFLIAPQVKLIFTRQRPTLFTPLEQLHDFSFPSGHTLGAITFYGMIAYLCWQNRHYVWALLCAIPLSLIPLSRVYLGVHYPSDILGAITLGIMWMGLVLLLCRVVAMHTQHFKYFNFKIGATPRLAPRKPRSEERDSSS